MHTDGCVCGVAKLVLGSGILVLIQTLLGIYKDMWRKKGNVFLPGKNMHVRHGRIFCVLLRGLYINFSLLFFFWADLNQSGRPKKTLPDMI